MAISASNKQAMAIEDQLPAYASAGAAILVAGAGALFKLLSIAVRKRIDEAKIELNQHIDAEDDRVVNQFGETVSAIRQKMTDMELWNRDNFVSQRAFDSIVTDIRDAWKRFEDKIDRRFDTLDRKLSKLNNDDGA